jgi:hypothetical protein
MRELVLGAIALLLSTEVAMPQEKIVISSPWGKLRAVLVDNEATSALLAMLPVTLEMHDHLRQEKTGSLPSSLPPAERQIDFENGTLGLWGSNDFVIYYRVGSVPRPGIIILGRVEGDASILDRTGSVTVQIERAN